jgi:hypothetical protein
MPEAERGLGEDGRREGGGSDARSVDCPPVVESLFGALVVRNRIAFLPTANEMDQGRGDCRRPGEPSRSVVVSADFLLTPEYRTPHPRSHT